jgi:hypothetical protein
MDATFTYHPRAKVLDVVVGSKRFLLPTHQDHPEIAGWEHQHDLVSSKYSTTDYDFIFPAGAQARRGHTCAAATAAISPARHRPSGQPPLRGKTRPIHAHLGAAIFIKDEHDGFFIHGWPPCNLRGCVVIISGWDDLFNALAGVDRLVLCIER